MFRYDANTGDFPKLGDHVEVVRSGDGNDGLKGRIGGWGDLDMADPRLSHLISRLLMAVRLWGGR